MHGILAGEAEMVESRSTPTAVVATALLSGKGAQQADRHVRLSTLWYTGPSVPAVDILSAAHDTTLGNEQQTTVAETCQ